MKYYRYSLNLVFLNIASLVIFAVFFVILSLMGYASLIDYRCLVIYFFWMFLHEFLHGVGFSLRKNVDHKKIVYGANLEKGIFYCMCKDIIDKRCIMISLMFPFVFIGVITLIIGLLFNIPILVILSLFNIAGCAGDIAMFISFLKLPDFKYTDLDDCTGYILISENDLSRFKLFGVKLVESGDYDPSVKAKDYKKFTISKLSWIVLIFMILLFFI